MNRGVPESPARVKELGARVKKLEGMLIGVCDQWLREIGRDQKGLKPLPYL